jgi:adenylosuccinate lyase
MRLYPMPHEINEFHFEQVVSFCNLIRSHILFALVISNN